MTNAMAPRLATADGDYTKKQCKPAIDLTFSILAGPLLTAHAPPSFPWRFVSLLDRASEHGYLGKSTLIGMQSPRTSCCSVCKGLGLPMHVHQCIAIVRRYPFGDLLQCFVLWCVTTRPKYHGCRQGLGEHTCVWMRS